MEWLDNVGKVMFYHPFKTALFMHQLPWDYLMEHFARIDRLNELAEEIWKISKEVPATGEAKIFLRRAFECIKRSIDYLGFNISENQNCDGAGSLYYGDKPLPY